MFENLRIKNFRLFDDLEIGDLKRINLLAGRNNTGKTAVLEAMYLLAGAGTPNRVLEITGIRGIGETQGAAGRLPKTYWKPLFSKLNMLRPIEISGTHSDLDRIDLGIFLTRRGPTGVLEPYRPSTLQQDQGMPSVVQAAQVPDLGEKLIDPWALHLLWERATEHKACNVRITDHSLEIVSTEFDIPFQAVFLSSGSGSSEDDAVRLGELRARKQGELLTKALQIVEPRLEGVESIYAGGTSMIWGDIGLPELTPLSAMGEGMRRIARIVLAMSVARGGIVLIDEIENGFHHTIMNKVWAVVEEAALQFDAQVIATTHSYECVMAAHEALRDEWRLHRLDRAKDGSSLCVTYDTETVEAAIRHDLEVR